VEIKMVKVKTSTKQKKSSKTTEKRLSEKGLKLIPYDPVSQVLDKNFIGKTIVECLENNDAEGVIEVINGYLDIANKVELAQRAQLARSTLYHSMKQKNPTLKTLAKIVHASSIALKK
jgi:DNA-binding phage protein